MLVNFPAFCQVSLSAHWYPFIHLSEGSRQHGEKFLVFSKFLETTQWPEKPGIEPCKDHQADSLHTCTPGYKLNETYALSVSSVHEMSHGAKCLQRDQTFHTYFLFFFFFFHLFLILTGLHDLYLIFLFIGYIAENQRKLLPILLLF